MEWQSCLGGSDWDEAYDILQLNDGYFIFGGVDSNDGDISFNHGGQDMWLVKIDNSGGLIWEKCYGGSDLETGDRVLNSVGSIDYFLVGSSSSNNGDISNNPYPGTRNLWVVKIDSSGNILWDRIIGNEIGYIYEINATSTSDGGLVIAAQIDSQGGDITSYFGGYDGWLIKLDSDGQTEWDQAIGSSTDFEFINEIIQTSDGGYLAGLYGTPQGAGTGNVECVTESTSKPDAILFKLDSNGNKEWEQCYGGSGGDGLICMIEIDDGYLVGALGGSNDGDLQGSGWHGELDIWLIRIDFTGNILWQKCYGGTRDEFPRKIFQTNDGDFIIIGVTVSQNGDVSGNHSVSEYDNDIWVIKVNSDGELISQQCIGGSLNEYVYFGAVKKSDNNFVIAGLTEYGPSYDVQCTPHGTLPKDDFWVFEIKDTTTNIKDYAEKSLELKVYPNPAKNYVVFEINKSPAKSEIIIVNIFGQEIAILPSIQEKTVWDTREIKNGFYYFNIEIDGIVHNGKIIVMK